MVEYLPLASASPTAHDDDEFDTLKHGSWVPHQSSTFNNSTTLTWLTILMGIMATFAAAAFHITILSETSRLPSIRSPNDVTSTLKMVRPSPNLEKGHANIKHWKKVKIPRMVFPRLIVRANEAEPNTVYQSGQSVLLSPSDSMFYHWKTKSAWSKCYITAWVSSPEKLIAGGKHYAAEGDVTAIEVWNVSSPNPLKEVTWNTRPRRLSLMGTVNFTTRDGQNQDSNLDGQELKRPTPLFDCSGMVDLTVEIACMSCRLQFDQIFSDPPLGFELLELA
ncbi:hypothetical protein PILCRDRAFT_823020 [Piloderma croceum F 1598]|uniref:Ubiquitin 3 binding protein But2 C-terminal domain-containing protein n=1 Tax=Piloderma croceum (strain F 1598) TaxID=765440 RepID=A0A0C3F547_PILCF|nr:hypothetical protein PILCRDRAFT_823020 [Piloderma croceum F 1598]